MSGEARPETFEITPAEADVLRRLGAEVAEIAALPVQAETADRWRRLNRVEPVRPPVYIYQVPWHELDGPETELETASPLARRAETQLRQTLYQWRHFRADMVVEAKVRCPIACEDTGYGLPAGGHRPEDRWGAAEYPSLIRSLEDVARIRTPRITPDHETTARRREALEAVFAGVLPVALAGPGAARSAWDLLIQWYGVETLMVDLVANPGLVHAAIGRTVDAMLARAEQLEAHGLLTLNNDARPTGNGGLAITDELPAADFAGHVRLADLWGNQMAQIFSCVSPAMHDEFALRHEIRILERFGLTSYGCCEPLDRKVEFIRKVPRLRRISMSPWVDVGRGARAVGRDYVYSAKPNPAALAADVWDPEPAREDLRRILEGTRGLAVELVLKDVHTVRGEPERLTRWADLAAETVDEYA